MYLGSNQINKFYLGNKEVNKVYLGSETIWELIPENPLTIINILELEEGICDPEENLPINIINILELEEGICDPNETPPPSGDITYYVDATNGDDSNSGTSEDQAWKTLAHVATQTFSPGDVIGFKRGEIWNERPTFNNLVGTETDPIIFTAYGAGDRPFIDGNVELSLTWTNESGEKWVAPFDEIPSRTWRDGRELKRTCRHRDNPTEAENEFNNRIADVELMWHSTDNELWLWSSDDPNNSTFVANTPLYTLMFNDCSYFKFDNIEVEGSYNCMGFEDCSYVDITNSKIAKNSTYGIKFSGNCHHFLIENNIFDNDFTATYDGIDSYAGASARGSDDGLVSWATFEDNVIRYNLFKNWSHTSVSLEETGGGSLKRNDVYQNHFLTDGPHYSRCILVSGDNSTDNEFHHNLIEGQWTRAQIQGHNNHIHHNHFKDGHDTPYKSLDEGQDIVLAPYNGTTTGNVYEYNTFENTENYAVFIEGYDGGSIIIENNTFHKNLFDGTGRNSYYSDRIGKQFIIDPFNDIGANTYTDNAFINTIDADGKAIKYKGTDYTPSEFNGAATDGDTISGNTDTPTDQGCGTLPPVGPQLPSGDITYYVDATNGDDSNSGTSEDQAWKTLGHVANQSFSPGDIIGFKRGGNWNERPAFSDINGTETDPIIFTAYGNESDPLPIFDGNRDLQLTWTNESGEKWVAPQAAFPERVWRDGVELKRTSRHLTTPTEAEDEFNNRTAGIELMWHSNGELWLWSSDDPNGSTFIGNPDAYGFDLANSSYVIFRNIDFRGAYRNIYLHDVSNLEFDYCNIARDCTYGMQFTGTSTNCKIHNCTIDNNFHLTYDGVASYTQTDARGSYDGIVTWSTLTNFEINNNLFKNWGHTSISFEDTGGGLMENNKIYSNYFFNDGPHYSRALLFSGNNSKNNEVYQNLIEGQWTRSQVQGHDNHIHHNHFKDGHDTPYKNRDEGQDIVLAPYNGTTTGNVYEYNTFENTENYAVFIEGYDGGSIIIENNTIHKNLFDGTGRNSYYSDRIGKQFIVDPYNDIGANTYTDNAFINTIDADGKAIKYKGTDYTPSEFNGAASNGDTISGNTDTPTDQGCGTLPPVGPELPSGDITYYVDATNGDDSNSGTSEDQAWKTLSKIENETFVSGDVIGFKRGEIWNEELNLSSLEGVTFTAYGSGNLPIISTLDYPSLSWNDNGDGTWSTTYSTYANRLWRDGTELKRTTDTNNWPDKAQEEFDNQIAGIEWMYLNNQIHLWSDTDPNNSTFKVNRTDRVSFSISDSNNVKIEYLDLRGGNYSLKIIDCEDMIISKNQIGYDGSYGLEFSGTCDNILVENNIFDNNFQLIFDGIESYRGTDARGSNDGIVSWDDLINSIIQYNEFKHWGHAGFSLSGGSSTNNKILYNIFDGDHLHYSRGIAYSGDNVKNNEFAYNYTKNMWVRGQMNGQDNHIHHNLFENFFDTPYKSAEEGQAVAFETYNGDVRGNLFEYNTFKNVEGPGFEIIGMDSSSPVIQNNTLHKNLFDNCGTNPYYSNALGKGLKVQDYADILDNTYTDNAFINSVEPDGKSIRHRNVDCTPEEFNNRDGVEGDSISGNTDTPTDQGCGTLPPVGPQIHLSINKVKRLQI